MNIFVLDLDPTKCAKYHCDVHVNKMLIESAQLLSTAHHILDGSNAPKAIYKKTHVNHPCNKWVRESDANYDWLYDLLFNLCCEFQLRRGKDHKTMGLLDILMQTPKNIPIKTMTPFALAMPDEYKDSDPVIAYRNYYIGDKSDIAKWEWSNAVIPYWWPYGP